MMKLIGTFLMLACLALFAWGCTFRPMHLKSEPMPVWIPAAIIGAAGLILYRWGHIRSNRRA